MFIDVSKNKDPLDKTNYRPVRVWLPVSKIFERLMQKQINGHIKNKLSPFLCGYRKVFSPQYALLSLIEDWKKILDGKGFGGAVLMDLSKGFDTLNHELFIAKLSAYGFNNESLKLIQSYLTNRGQRTKINKSFSRWTELLQGVAQGLVLGPLLFNIYFDLFLLDDYTEVCNFVDDTTFFARDKDLGSLINRSEHDSFLAIEWFQNNYMKLNEDKCYLLAGGHKHESIWAKIGDARIWESNKQKLLGVHINRALSFDEHNSNLCKKVDRKLSFLARLSSYMTLTQRRVLMKSFIEALGYCPLVWMFYGRVLNRKINHLHKRSLRII